MSTDNAEYMRQYRARAGNPSGAARSRAMSYAATWVRQNHPDVWEELLTAAYRDLGIVRYPQGRRRNTS